MFMVVWNKGLKGEDYLKHYNSQQIWCKGLTKDTDIRIAKYAKKKTGKKFTKKHRNNISKNKREFLNANPDFLDRKSGEVKRWWENHPEKRREARKRFSKLWKGVPKSESQKGEMSKNNIMNDKEWIEKNRKGKNSSQWKGGSIDVLCNQCGKTIKCLRVNIKQEMHFCSHKCHGKWLAENKVGEKHPTWQPRIDIVCEYCGIVSERRNCNLKNHMFCSRACANKWKKGVNNTNWVGGYFPYYGISWNEAREKAMERAEYVSEISGSNGGLLNTHHIISMGIFVDKFMDLCLKHCIGGARRESLKVIGHEIIPELIFEEANSLDNLIVLTKSEHCNYEHMPSTFFESIRKYS